MKCASRRARPYVINSALRHASAVIVRKSAAAVPKVSSIMKRKLSASFGASWIVKAGEVLPQALIPAHEKRALKADASCKRWLAPCLICSKQGYRSIPLPPIAAMFSRVLEQLRHTK
jgi:hypothetical protein